MPQVLVPRRAGQDRGALAPVPGRCRHVKRRGGCRGAKGGGGRIAAAGLAGLLFYFLKNPSALSQWASAFSGAVEKISGRAARHGAATDIQGKMAAFVKSAHMDAPMPYGLKIKWIAKGGDETCADKSDVVVIMEYRWNGDRDFVAAAQQCTPRAPLCLQT